MRDDIVAGAVFPDYELTDHTGKHRKLSELQGPDPMILVLSRGRYCPKDLRQAEGLVQLHHEMEVGYSRHESPRHRGGLAAGKCHRSWWLDLTAAALLQDPSLSRFAGHVSDSGEGRWTIKAAIDEAVPAPVLTTALYERFSSRGEADFANRLLSAMRY